MDRRAISRLGGLARARKLTAERRSEIARLGFEALVLQRFGGDRQAAIDWLTRAGLAAQDDQRHGPGQYRRVFRPPGPMPGKLTWREFFADVLGRDPGRK